MIVISEPSLNSNTTFVKVKFLIIFVMDNINLIQIQHLLKLNECAEEVKIELETYSNTTFVKVKL